MWDALRGGSFWGILPVFTRVSGKTTENSERLGRQKRLGIEPGTSRLLALIAEPLTIGGRALLRMGT